MRITTLECNQERPKDTKRKVKKISKQVLSFIEYNYMYGVLVASNSDKSDISKATGEPDMKLRQSSGCPDRYYERDRSLGR